jgi:hypothetical protein
MAPDYEARLALSSTAAPQTSDFAPHQNSAPAIAASGDTFRAGIGIRFVANHAINFGVFAFEFDCIEHQLRFERCGAGPLSPTPAISVTGAIVR